MTAEATATFYTLNTSPESKRKLCLSGCTISTQLTRWPKRNAMKTQKSQSALAQEVDLPARGPPTNTVRSERRGPLDVTIEEKREAGTLETEMIEGMTGTSVLSALTRGEGKEEKKVIGTSVATITLTNTIITIDTAESKDTLTKVQLSSRSVVVTAIGSKMTLDREEATTDTTEVKIDPQE